MKISLPSWVRKVRDVVEVVIGFASLVLIAVWAYTGEFPLRFLLPHSPETKLMVEDEANNKYGMSEYATEAERAATYSFDECEALFYTLMEREIDQWQEWEEIEAQEKGGLMR